MAGKTIAVLGAGGHTGRFVVAELERRGAAVRPFTRTGRFTPNGAGETASPRLDLSQTDDLARDLAGADAVINCAGPFLDTAGPAVEAAIRAGIPYLDLAAEQVTAQRLFERHDEPARAAGTTIVPAMAFFGGLADLLASSLVRPAETVERIDIAVGLDSWHPTSGTRLTGRKNTYQRLIVRDHQLVAVPTPPPATDWDFPAPLGAQPVTCVPLSEIILIARHLKPAAMTSYMNLKPLADLKAEDSPAPEAVDSRGRSAQSFMMDVRATISGETRRATASGQDIYAVSAPLIVAACLRLLEANQPPTGVRAPGELFDARSFLTALSPDIGVRYW
ncbi:MAG: saccharopine dehydrogenase NADP-binding domain-containing protein [Oceanibaculum sp.]